MPSQMNLPGYQYPGNALVNFEPINDAIDSNRANALAQDRMGLERQRMGMERERLDMTKQSAADARQEAARKRIGGMALLALQEKDDAKRAAMHQQLMAMHPAKDSLASHYNDPNAGLLAIVGDAGMADDYLKFQLQQQQARLAAAAGDRQAQLFPYQLQNAQLETKTRKREYENPAQRITVVPDGSSAILTDQRTGKSKVVAGGTPKSPAGYRPSGDGNLEPIPGGPADIKINEKRQQDFASVQQLTQGLDSLQRSANEVLQHKGLAGNFGMSGMVPNIPGGSAADAAALLETLKTKAAFATLQDMRNASKTGGALGAVSDYENRMLQSAIAALGKAQSFDQVQKQLKLLIDETERSKQRIRNAYEDHWNKGAAGPSRAAPETGVFDWTPDGGLKPAGGR